MILDNAQLVDDQDATHFSQRTNSVCLLHMEAQDSLQSVLNVLRSQTKPVLLFPYGDALSQPEHFAALRQQQLLPKGHPPFLCLIIPPERERNVVGLADHYQIPSAPTVEDALPMLIHSTHPNQAADDRGQIPPTTHQVTEARELLSFQPTLKLTSTSKKRRYLLGASIFALLLAASAVIVPLMLFTPTHTSSATAAIPVGTLSFGSSGQLNPDLTEGYNDMLTLSLRRLPPPPEAMSYDVWLMPDSSDDSTLPLLLSTRQGGPVNLTYAPASHTNLLATYSGIRITVQPSGNTPEMPSGDPRAWKWQGFFPNTPTPGDENHYSLLSHLRHLLAKDPVLQVNKIPGGLDLWLTRNVGKVEEWASAAQGDWHGMQTSSGDADQLHRQLLRILEYLDGASYYQRDVPAGSPWLVDALAGKIGLLDSVQNQQPPGFLAHVDIHLTGLAGSPGHTVQQQQLAMTIDKVILKMRRDLLQVRKDAVALVKINAQQLRQSSNQATLDDMMNLTTEVKSGWFDPQTGENMGGVLWINSRLQQLAVLPVVSATA